ncbi:MAG: spermidine/putrescine ABC transporter ATP-binding protein [Rhodospirillaceae bacterium]|nr:spermidine/putrescine ABC transporter ATP-binding protein [Rhodospirillaceae bacterium]|tara:strand:- start:471 stop:1538 length:1068 start_codon:yes stop_codon:yes gene_type:complete
MSGVRLDKIVKSYGSTVAVNDVSLDIREGEFLTLLGPSGCGKTTTLRLISGFIQPTSGAIHFGNKDVTGIAPQHRQIGMVFQDYALFPHLTVSENISFGLVERRYEKVAIKKRVGELLALIKLEEAADRYPSEISGGQAQRVAVARAVAHPPSVLLMDEPLGALDLKLRETMQAELRRIQQELGITAVYVTHDQSEAMNMSDRIVVMNEGIIEQIGSPRGIYSNPQSVFVANFIGQVNVLNCKVTGIKENITNLDYNGQNIRAQHERSLRQGTNIFLAIRPEDIKITEKAIRNPQNTLKGVVSEALFSGNVMKISVELESGDYIKVECQPKANSFELGSPVQVNWLPEDCNILLN